MCILNVYLEHQETLNHNLARLPLLNDMVERWQTDRLASELSTFSELWESLPREYRNRHEQLNAARYLYDLYKSFAGASPPFCSEDKSTPNNDIYHFMYPEVFYMLLKNFYKLQPKG